MNTKMFFKMMLKFERLVTLCAFKFSKQHGLFVADHVSLQSVDVGECFLAFIAILKIIIFYVQKSADRFGIFTIYILHKILWARDNANGLNEG